jgi:hypothetical protein
VLECTAIAKRGLPNNAEAGLLEALMDRRQGNWEKAIREFNEVITRDRANKLSNLELAITLFCMRRLDAAGQAFNRAIDLAADQPILKVLQAYYVVFMKTGSSTAIRSAISALPASMADNLDGLLPTELMYQHQQVLPPFEKLGSIPTPIIAVLEILLAKDPGQRFQNPGQLQKAVSVARALSSGSNLSANDLRLSGDAIPQRSRHRPRNSSWRWPTVSGLSLAALLLGWFFFSTYRSFIFDYKGAETAIAEKSIAVLPFESLSGIKTTPKGAGYNTSKTCWTAKDSLGTWLALRPNRCKPMRRFFHFAIEAKS